jgi:hypothetical protein
LSDAEAGIQAPLSARLGRRNQLYLGFLAGCLLLVVLGLAATGSGDAAGRGMGALLGIGLWALVTVPFAIWNLVAFLSAAVQGRPVRVPGIALLLVILCIALGGFVLDALWHAIY